ncbi:transcriptional regulator TdcA [Salmonella enterica subsp. enterica serovar Morehead]|nr:transcriptional regulator TdcA [Salmonella enterica subsp. enterica serovar Newport]EBY2753088.1 transcriptional regulator TdcA [Salmonella enterica subsp. enterica serovar Kottbus]EEM2539454.1 transcriptional regulator TdcA [Salmonella enterica subsp. enterica serovar Morehead]EHN5888773.1 transcriptional regulator TdcA [Salmonella enterica subsp. enterica serovar Newport]
MDILKTQHLVTFMEVVRCGSIRSAAQSLGVTQPAVTRIIHEIENYLGTELIIRSCTGVKLTEAGHRLVPHSRIILKDIDLAVADIRSLCGASSGEVAFGFSSLIGFTVLPELVKYFHKKYPAIQLSIQEAQLSELLPALRDGRLDFVIGTVNTGMPVQNMVVCPLFNAEFSFIARHGHPLAQCETLQALSHARWVLPQTDMGYYHDLFSQFKHYMVKAGSMVRTDSVITIYNLVTCAGFISVLAQAMASPFRDESIIEIPVRDVLPTAHYAIVYQRDKKISKEAEALINEIKKFSWVRYKGLTDVKEFL